MKSVQVAALTALLSAGAQAAPAHGHGLLKHAAFHHKRDIVWETKYEIETVTVVRTVYDNGDLVTDNTYAPTVAPTTTSTLAAYTSTTSSTTSQAPAPTLPSPSETGAPSYQAPVPVPVTTSSTTTVAPVPVPAPVTTSAAPPPVYTTAAPVPTTTVAPAPAPAPSSSEAPAPAPSAPSTGGGSYGGDYTHSGDATWYQVGSGACGGNSVSTDMIVAVSNELFAASMATANPNNAAVCGKTVNIKGHDGQNHVATIVDRCMGCAKYDLDMSASLFKAVTGSDDGRFPGTEWGSSMSF